MKDSISDARIKELHPHAQDIFRHFLEECEKTLGITLRIMEPVFRTIKEQNDLYAQGRTKPGKVVTNAKGGSSFHNYGLAVDLCHLVNGAVDWSYDMGKLVPIANKYGIEWGGNWVSIKDKPHFQKTFGHTWQQLFNLYNTGHVDAHGYVDLGQAGC